MKNFTRILGLVLALVLMLSLIACGGKDMSDSPYIGTWKATSAEISGISVSVEEVLGGEFKFELKDNGKCVLTIDGDTQNGNWDEIDNGFSVEDEFEIIVDGDSGVMDYEGMTVNFERV